MEEEKPQILSDSVHLQTVLSLYRLELEVTFIPRTIILYDVYQQSSDLCLTNLKVFGQFITNPKCSVNVKNQISRKIIRYRYSIPDGESSIKRKNIRIGSSSAINEQQPSPEDIVVYESEDSQLRVVTLPLSKDLIDDQKQVKFFQELTRHEKQMKKSFKDDALQGQGLRKAHEALKIEREHKVKQFGQSKKWQYLKMFQIEGVLSCFLKNTDKISYCCLAQFQTGRFKDVNQYLKQFKQLFLTPKGYSPQLFLHSYSEDEEGGNSEWLQRSESSIVLSISEDNQLLTKKDIHLDEVYYLPSEKNNSRGISFFQQMGRGKGQHEVLREINQHFINSWKEITFKTCCSFARLVIQIQSKYSSQLEQDDYLSIEQLEKVYGFTSLRLPTLSKLSLFSFLQDQKDRLSSWDKEQVIIPQQIKPLVCIHFFQKLSRQFLDDYLKTERKYERDQTAILVEWSDFIKKIYEVLMGLGYFRQRHSDQQVQQLFNVVSFMLKGSQIVKKITGIELGVSMMLKSALQKIKPKRDLVRKNIIANQKGIQKDQSILYYDLLLLMVKDTTIKELQKETRYIECYLLQLKAYRIATEYIYDQHKIVQAIKSYAQICIDYPTLNYQKRQLINILDIEKRMARLLMIVHAEDIVVEIYFKNRMIGMAHKACQYARSYYGGQQKAGKLMGWGRRFQRQLQYELAMGYYRDAYECAESIVFQKEAIMHKVQCNRQKKSIEPESVLRQFNKFISPQTTNTSEFISSNLLTLYLRIKDDLQWHQDIQRAVIKGNPLDQSRKTHSSASSPSK